MSNIFENGKDDFVFPTTAQGIRQAGILLYDSSVEKEERSQDSALGLFESTVSTSYDTNTRSEAISALLTWIEGGEYDYESMAGILFEIADIDMDGDISEDEEETYNDLWALTADAMVYLGAKEDDVVGFYNGPGTDADAAGARIASQIQVVLEEEPASDEDLITGFAFSSDAITESAEQIDAIYEVAFGKLVKRVKNGVVQRVRKAIHGKGFKVVGGKLKKMTAEMKAAVRKMLKKARSGSAKMHRKISMKKRKTMGLNK
ncbi:MAG: hypothetical protein IJU76_14295 [Desulfovibrionaceae bacterium]|nr:hypothetical protein [Desulfovibrionaceae bacterium]